MRQRLSYFHKQFESEKVFSLLFLSCSHTVFILGIDLYCTNVFQRGFYKIVLSRGFREAVSIFFCAFLEKNFDFLLLDRKKVVYLHYENETNVLRRYLEI